MKSDFKTVSFPRLIAGDDDDFGGVRMEKFLAGRSRFKDVFDGSD